jgi:polar amino acid transport system substrate-binding protein
VTGPDRRTVTSGLLGGLLGGLAAPACAVGPAAPEVVRAIAPTGRLRAAINYGNAVLAHRDPSGALGGISVDLANELARRLGLPLDLVPFDAAGKVTASAAGNIWDVGFLAVDPGRAEEIAFTAPYVVIEGTYAVRDASPLREIADFDREGVRIAVGRGSAYDLYLTRALTRATLVRAETSPAAIALFVSDGLEAVAGVKQPIVAFARDTPGYRAIPGRFSSIEQAMGVPKGRDAAASYLRGFVEEMKASGFVAEALVRHRQPDAAVAPPAG